MTLYYSLVFLMLVTEMVIFMALILPLPFTWRVRLFTFISDSPVVAKLQYGMKIAFIFILILFVDSVNRVYRVQVELATVQDAKGASADVLMAGSARMEVQARKFYSQRNMYLCGFTLFLSLILNRTYVMILDTLRLEEEVKRMKKDESSKGNATSAGDAGEVATLRKQLEAKTRDLETLKTQSEGLGREYNTLGDQFNSSNGTPKKDL